ncbi:hypothetical protein SAMN05421831_110101 [Allopseudospirillum japonicum]|uniref:Uncharacterized protein n=1 Tax=Allopseudospirillum japonicum TaxID=64971 RepID=A0A1H6TTN8_9GAMM|nr:hypothetical protein [Allopseudospirillum japonicum]SEI79575.1 hypothetical protein SAMN05421831_110101 [Allopseudospirillum japonicum]
MKKLLTSSLLLVTVPFMQAAHAEDLHFAAGSLIQAEALVTQEVLKGQTSEHIQLKPSAVDNTGMPEYCLMSARASLQNESVRLDIDRLLCLSEDRHYYEGVLIAQLVDEEGKPGDAQACTSEQDGICQRGEIRAGHKYTLKVTAESTIPMVVNQSEQLNIMRRQAAPEQAQ